MNVELDITDIHEHLPTLAAISEECSHITEMGVRDGVSTWAFMEGLQKTHGKLVSIDLNYPPEPNLKVIQEVCKEIGVDFEFKQGDSRKINIEPTDMLFIDTEHTYEHLMAELDKQEVKAKKYIVLHDTESVKSMWPAVGKLITWGWKIKAHYPNNNGLTILERI